MRKHVYACVCTIQNHVSEGHVSVKYALEHARCLEGINPRHTAQLKWTQKSDHTPDVSHMQPCGADGRGVAPSHHLCLP